jgi:hypothetical protein
MTQDEQNESTELRANPLQQSATALEPGEIPDNVPATSSTIGTNQHSGTPTGGGTTGLTGTQTSRRRRLETFVELFREGKKSRIEAFAAILGELEQEPNLSPEEKDSTFRIFGAEIDSAETRANRSLANTRRPETFAPKPNQLQPQHSDEESAVLYLRVKGY